jgi:hypothetical protein
MAYTDLQNIVFNSINTDTSQANSFHQIVGDTIAEMTDAQLKTYFKDKGKNIPTIVNAVEIDWNGAELGSTYDGISRINTTGELIKVIQG